MEKYLRWLAIPGLLKGIALLTAITWVIGLIHPSYMLKLVLIPQLVLAGEWYRLVSFAVVPLVNDSYYGIEIPFSNGIWMLMNVLFLWWASNVLEREAWGTYRTTMYVLCGMLGVILASMLFGTIGTFFSVNLSIFLALSTLAPDFKIFIMAILPVRLKWVGFALAVMFPLTEFVRGGWSPKFIVLLSYGNYLLFFVPLWLGRWRDSRDRFAHQKRFEERRREDEKDTPNLHTCSLCGRTEVSNPELDFRVSGADEKEYCMEHLPKALSK